MKTGKKLLAFLTVFTMLLGSFALPALAATDDGPALETMQLSAMGRISLHKVDDRAANVAGATYAILWEFMGNWVSYYGFTMTTGADGIATSAPLIAGIDYKVAEISVPFIYELNTVPSDSITVLANQTVAFPSDFVNIRKKATVTIAKWVDCQPYIGDKTFTYTMTNDRTGESFTGSSVGATPCVFENVPFGTYTLQETGIPDGYAFHAFVEVLDKVPCDKSIDKLNVDCLLEFVACKNIRTANIRVTKDDGNGKMLAGAQFELYRKGCSGWEPVNLGYVPQTDGDGLCDITGLPLGEYMVKEIAAPMGYSIDGEWSGPQCLCESNETKTFAFSDTQLFGSVTVNKAVEKEEGDDTDDPVFKVEITGPSNNPNVPSSTIFQDITVGTTTVGNLAYGNYTISETAAPGYAPIINPASFTIGGEGGQSAVVNITNTKLYGSAVIKKVVTNYDGAETFQVRLTGTRNEQTVYDEVISVSSGDADGEPVSGLPYGHYTVTEESVPAGYANVSITPEEGFDINGEARTAEVVVTNRGFGSIRILKLDSRSTEGNEIPVPGTHFEVYRMNGDAKEVVLTDGVTGSDGTLTVPGLPVGVTYWAREIQQAPAYNLIDATRAYELVVPDSTVTAEAFVNDPIGRIAVEKKDSVSGAMLGGVGFGVYRSEADANNDANRVDTLTTASSGASLGKAVSNDLVLTAETTSFWVKELGGPANYTPDAAARKVDIEFNGRTVPVVTATFANNPVLRLVINKYDASTVVNDNYDGATKLAGAVFGVYRDSACTQQVGTNLTTGTSPLGTVSVDLPCGGANPTTYYVKELAAPAGYIVGNAEPVAVTYTQNDQPGKTVTLNFADPRNVGSVVIKKIDALDNTKTLAGAQFKLYSDAALTAQVGAAATTGADGIARFDNLAPGAYYLKEVAAPKDYKLPADAIPVTVTAGNTNPQALVITNQYNPPEPIVTGMMDYNVLLLGGVALAGGSSLLLITRKKRGMKK